MKPFMMGRRSTSGGGGSEGGGGGGAIIPSFVAATDWEHSAGSVTFSSAPTGYQADDVFLLLQETKATDGAPVAPAGWAEVTNSPSTDSTTRISVFWKRTDGTETDPLILSDAGDHQMAVILAFRNCALTGNPWDVTAAGAAGSSTTSISVPTVTTTGTDRLILAIATSTKEADSTTEFSGWTNANLTGITEIVDFTESNGDGGGIGAAYGFKATAGATGATTATSANATRHAYLTIALKGQT